MSIEIAKQGPPEPMTRARELVLQVTGRPFPGPRRMAAVALWWVRQLPPLVIRAPGLVLAELLPICRGLGRCAVAWAEFVHNAEQAERIREADGKDKHKAGERLIRRRMARGWGSLLVAIAAVIGLWWLYVVNFPAFVAVCTVIVLVFDAIGHRRGATPAPRLATPTVLTEGVPLSQITKSIFETFEREGFEEGSVSLASPLVWDPDRKEYRIRIKTADQIKREHVGAVERAIGARDFAIRNLATNTASVRELVIRVGDPLAHTPPPEMLESHSRSIAEPLDLGLTAGDVPFEVTFAGVHALIVGATGSGKTKGLIWGIIDRLSACRDVVIWGCDLARGPALPMWRGVIQKRAQTPEEAEQLLAAAIAEIERRMAILTAIAEDDDPDNDTDEWHSGLGPALVLVFDEFALLAEYDGTKGRLNLLGKCEQIVRTGRKVWVTLIRGTQKTGNSDDGSTVMATQVGIKIALACSDRDTLNLFGIEKRDQGWSPHLLSPSVEGDVRDAGKCFVESPAHRTPDVYRTYAPLAPAEVKHRAQQRIADGLPRLDGGKPRATEVVDAVEVPPIVAAVADVFEDEQAEHIPTVDLLRMLDEHGVKVTDQQLSDAMMIDGERCRARWRDVPGGPQIRGYTREWVQRKIRSLG